MLRRYSQYHYQGALEILNKKWSLTLANTSGHYFKFRSHENLFIGIC